MVIFWASAITCFPTRFKYVVQSTELGEQEQSHLNIYFFYFQVHSLELHKAHLQVAKSILFKDMCLKRPNMTSKVDCLENCKMLQWDLFIALPPLQLNSRTVSGRVCVWIWHELFYCYGILPKSIIIESIQSVFSLRE